MDRRARTALKSANASDLFSKLREVQDDLERVRKDYVENINDTGRRDDYLLILGSSVRLSLSLCRLLQSELELLRKEQAARTRSRVRKRAPIRR